MPDQQQNENKQQPDENDDQSQQAGSPLIGKLKVVALVAGVVFVECAFAYMFIPTAVADLLASITQESIAAGDGESVKYRASPGAVRRQMRDDVYAVYADDLVGAENDAICIGVVIMIDIAAEDGDVIRIISFVEDGFAADKAAIDLNAAGAVVE